MLGAECSGCCGGCQDLVAHWEELIALPVSYSFQCSGADGFPQITINETVESGEWDLVFVPGAESYWGRVVTGYYNSLQWWLYLSITRTQDYGWMANFQLDTQQQTTSLLKRMNGTFKYECLQGTTLVEPVVYYGDPNSQLYTDYVEPVARYEGQDGCCCAQYGATTIFPDGGRLGVCTDGLSSSPFCDEAINDSGQVVGVCKKRPQPFTGQFSFTRYHTNFSGAFVQFDVMVPDWKMYRTNPLP